jgi:hypothetical protein
MYMDVHVAVQCTRYTSWMSIPALKKLNIPKLKISLVRSTPSTPEYRYSPVLHNFQRVQAERVFSFPDLRDKIKFTSRVSKKNGCLSRQLVLSLSTSRLIRPKLLLLIFLSFQILQQYYLIKIFET